MRKVLLALATLLASAGTAAARFGMGEPLTDRGRVVEDIYSKIIIAGMLVFLLVFVLLVYVLIRYREGSGKGRATHEKHRGSLGAELTWTLLPLLIVLWVGYIAYAGLVTLDKGNEDVQPEMTLHVTGVQWAWIMDYGSGVKVTVAATPDAKGNLSYSDTFHVPADVPLALNLTGGDVIHAFNVLDGNRVYFFMEDANPLGPHKYHNQTVVFPAGSYEIQCKEMCLNPGHGYMRARLVAEPRAQFDRWLEERSLAVGATLLKKAEVKADSDSLDTPDAANGTVTIVKGTRVLLDVANTGSSPLQVTLPGGATKTVAAGQSEFMAFDVPAVGDVTVTASNGGHLTFHAIDAKVVDIDLASYTIRPQVAQFEKGQTYLVNVHAADSVHNYYIGHWDGGNGAKQVVAHSENVNGGSVGAFIFTPEESGTYDAWCDISGHYGLGMHEHATVS